MCIGPLVRVVRSYCRQQGVSRKAMETWQLDVTSSYTVLPEDGDYSSDHADVQGTENFDGPGGTGVPGTFESIVGDEAQNPVGRLPSAGTSPSPSHTERRTKGEGNPQPPAGSEIRNSKFSNPADRVPDTSALGSAIDEARLLHLTKQMNEIRAVLRRG